MKVSAYRLRQAEPETPYTGQNTTGQSDEFARLTEETERLAQHVQELRLRIAATARRRNSSGCQPAQEATVLGEALPGATEQLSRVAPTNERASCLASVSRWLPPLAPLPAATSSVTVKNDEAAGRYSLVIPRRRHHVASEELAPQGKLKMPA